MVRLHAVLIGINRYADLSIPDLRFARSDAERWKEVLDETIHTDDVRSYLLPDEEGTRENILRLVGTDLPSLVGGDDVVLIYFAGHGSPEADPSLDAASRFLVCHDSKRASLISTAIDVGIDLPRLSSRLRARLVLFVLDACFSGYSGGRGIIGPRLEGQRRSHRPQLRLRELPLGEGIAFLAACGDDEVAWEEATLKQGVFSYHLLSELVAPGPARVVGLPTLYDAVFSRVRSYTNGAQNPVLWGSVKGASLPRLLDS